MAVVQTKRSRLLPLLLSQQSKDYTTAGGLAGMQAYRGYRQLGQESDAANAAGTANIVGSGLTALGGMTDGTLSKLAQVAGLMTSKYAKDKAREDIGYRRAQMLATPLDERDDVWHRKMSNLIYDYDD